MKKPYRSKLAYALAAALLLMLFAGCTAPAEAESASPDVTAASAAQEETVPPSPAEETSALETERVLPTRNFEVDDTDVVVSFTVEDLYDTETGRFEFAPLPWGISAEKARSAMGVDTLPMVGDLGSVLWYVLELEEMDIRFFPGYIFNGPAGERVLEYVSFELARPPLTDNLDAKIEALLTALTAAFGEYTYSEQEMEEPTTELAYTSCAYDWFGSGAEGRRNGLFLIVDTVDGVPARVCLEVYDIAESTSN